MQREISASQASRFASRPGAVREVREFREGEMTGCSGRAAPHNLHALPQNLRWSENLDPAIRRSRRFQMQSLESLDRRCGLESVKGCLWLHEQG